MKKNEHSLRLCYLIKGKHSLVVNNESLIVRMQFETLEALVLQPLYCIRINGQIRVPSGQRMNPGLFGTQEPLIYGFNLIRSRRNSGYNREIYPGRVHGMDQAGQSPVRIGGNGTLIHIFQGLGGHIGRENMGVKVNDLVLHYIQKYKQLLLL